LKDKIIVGMAGAEFGVRGFIDAYDAKTGKRVWRCWTIPGPGEPGHETWSNDAWKTGGGSTWGLGTFDPELNTIYWGTGNPSPDYDGDVRPGDNKWTCSLLAIDPDTGKIKWGFQYTPHDVHDWDANQVPVLIDAPINGQMRKLAVAANRNTYYYVLDRTNGKFITGSSYVKQTWSSGLDENGRPILLPGKEPTREGTLVYPGLGGSANWMPPAYNPQTGLLYVQSREGYGQYYYKFPMEYSPGEHFEGGGARNVLGEESWGVLKALEATTGKIKWEYRILSFAHTPVLSTAGNLVISGTHEGQVYALDARTGKLLWQFTVGSTVYGGPVTYLVDGKQHVAVSSGAGLFVFSLVN
jgi:alcohol dehydrogenase (cytochrome c)